VSHWRSKEILETGRLVEKIVGRKLRSECIRTGRIPKSLKEKKKPFLN